MKPTDALARRGLSIMGNSSYGKPRLLDLFCKAGGATKGYQNAGFYVVGVDIEPQPNYCGDEFYQCDALEVLAAGKVAAWLVEDFDAIHASPPCQRWMGVPGALGDEYPDLIGPVRSELRRIGLPYVIENIPTAPIDGPVLCGLTFGLPVVRHRRFEVRPTIDLWPSTCPQSSFERSVGHPGCYPFAHGAWRPAWRKYVMPVLWPWMTLEETHDAIPPAYTEWIGGQLRSENLRGGTCLCGMVGSTWVKSSRCPLHG